MSCDEKHIGIAETNGVSTNKTLGCLTLSMEFGLHFFLKSIRLILKFLLLTEALFVLQPLGEIVCHSSRQGRRVVISILAFLKPIYLHGPDSL